MFSRTECLELQASTSLPLKQVSTAGKSEKFSLVFSVPAPFLRTISLFLCRDI